MAFLSHYTLVQFIYRLGQYNSLIRLFSISLGTVAGLVYSVEVNGQTSFVTAATNELKQEKWVVKKSVDFQITGKGDDPAWDKAAWGSMIKIDSGGRPYNSRFKILYSTKGIYVLFAGEDNRITTKDYKDYEEIYEGDVFEVFFHPEPEKPQYFEYEINQLDKELILTLVHGQGDNLAWAPWPKEYNQKRAVQKKVAVQKGQTSQESLIQVNSVITSWTAEIFFPYSIFGLLPDSPPQTGASWGANFCRIDYDSGKIVQWSWSKAITNNFHDLEKFGMVYFE